MISVGPLALALERLFAVLGIMAFMAAASWIGRRHGKDSGKAAWRALLAGLIAARASFVAQNWSAFAFEPLSVLYVWQGGFSTPVGLLAAAISLVLSLLDHKPFSNCRPSWDCRNRHRQGRAHHYRLGFIPSSFCGAYALTIK